MLVESLFFSWHSFALPVWGPTFLQDSLHRITRLHNRAVRITCDLTKSDPISHLRQVIGWLSPTMLAQYQSLCAVLDQYISKGISLDPLIHFGSLHSYSTRFPPHFATTLHSRLCFPVKRQLPGVTPFQMISYKICLLSITIYMIIYCMVCNYVLLV